MLVGLFVIFSKIFILFNLFSTILGVANGTSKNVGLGKF